MAPARNHRQQAQNSEYHNRHICVISTPLNCSTDIKAMDDIRTHRKLLNERRDERILNTLTNATTNYKTFKTLSEIIQKC